MVCQGNIERPAMVAIVFDESEKRGSIEQDGQSMQNFGRHTFFVRFMEHHGMRPMMTTAPTRDAIGAIRIGCSCERRKRHGETLMRWVG